jgi:WD40 repeat protein
VNGDETANASRAVGPTPGEPIDEPPAAVSATVQRRRLLVAAAVVASAALAGTATIVLLRGGSDNSPSRGSVAVSAVADRMTADATRLQATDPTLSIRLRAAAYALDGTDQRRVALAADLIAPRPRHTVSTGAEQIDALAVAPDGSTVVVGGSGKTELWRIEQNAPPVRIAAFPDSAGQVSDAAFTPDGATVLLSAGVGVGVELWDVRDTAKPVLLETLPPGSIGGQPISSDGKRLILGGDKSAYLWDISQPKAPRLLMGLPAEDQVIAAAFSPDGKTVALGQWGRTKDELTLWDVADLEAPSRLGSVPLEGHVGDVAISPDNRLVLFGNEDWAELWDITDRREPRHRAILGDHTGQIHGVAFSPDGSSAVTVGYRSANLWSLAEPSNPAYVATLTRGAPVVAVARFTPDGQHVITAGWDGRLDLWHAATAQTARNADLRPAVAGASSIALEASRGDDDSIYDLAVSEDGTRTVAAYWDGPLVIWDTANPRAVRKLGTVAGARLAVWTSDGTRLITAEAKSGAALWDVATPSRPKRLVTLATGAKVTSAAVTADGMIVVTGGDDGKAHVWDVSSPQKPRRLATLPDNGGDVASVAISADSDRLMVTSTYDTVSVWDISTPAEPRQTHTLREHFGGGNATAFTANGTAVMTADGHGTSLLWDLQQGVPSPKPASTVRINDDEPVRKQRFHASDDIASMYGGEEPGALFLVTDLAQPRRLTELPAQAVSSAAAWADDGRTTVTVTGPSQMLIWRLDKIHQVLTDPLPRACEVARRGLDKSEWRKYADGVNYRETCDGVAPALPDPIATLAGSWRVHGSRLDIKADRTGQQVWNAGPCRSSFEDNVPMCTGYAAVSFTADGDSLTGTITDVDYKDEHGRSTSNQELTKGGPHKGDTFKVRRVDLDVLAVTQARTDQQVGNHYYCGPAAGDAWRDRCNA